jgi:hypothetical protein
MQACLSPGAASLVIFKGAAVDVSGSFFVGPQYVVVYEVLRFPPRLPRGLT